jgi:uncharacterized protein YndB with AHSA1/START domain
VAEVSRLARAEDEVSAVIKASPEKVWDLIADVTRMGDWSPVCRRCEWLGSPAGPEPGARFVGHNRQSGARWSRQCVVTVAEPGREFGFSTLLKEAESTRWLYRLEPSGAATKVSEAYESVTMPRWVRALRRIPGFEAKSKRDAHRGMEVTLARIKAAAEGEAR